MSHLPDYQKILLSSLRTTTSFESPWSLQADITFLFPSLSFSFSLTLLRGYRRVYKRYAVRLSHLKLHSAESQPDHDSYPSYKPLILHTNTLDARPHTRAESRVAIDQHNRAYRTRDCLPPGLCRLLTPWRVCECDCLCDGVRVCVRTSIKCCSDARPSSVKAEVSLTWLALQRCGSGLKGERPASASPARS